jgi:hypothetical protein
VKHWGIGEWWVLDQTILGLFQSHRPFYSRLCISVPSASVYTAPAMGRPCGGQRVTDRIKEDIVFTIRGPVKVTFRSYHAVFQSHWAALQRQVLRK